MKMLRITLEGKTYDVGVEVLEESASPLPHANLSRVSSPAPPPSAAPSSVVTAPPPEAAPSRAAATPIAAPVAAEGGRGVTSPMAGVVLKCMVRPGEAVTLNQVLLVLDAMKMETPIHAPAAGTVLSVPVKAGDTVDEGTLLVQIGEQA